MHDFISSLSYWLAFIISFGSLFFYLNLAFVSRRSRKLTNNESYDFHLGIPSLSSGLLKNADNEKVFAYALVAAGTSLSTVFVFFLTASYLYGWLIILSPLMFCLGNYIMFAVYKKAVSNGYFDEAEDCKGLTGLIPYLGEKISGNRFVGLFLVALSFLNLLSVLVLELFIGAEIISYLTSKAFGIPLPVAGEFSVLDFIIFIISIILLFGYVFIGGFKAVVASDYWQLKVVKSAIILVFLSLLIKVGLSFKKLDFSGLSLKASNVTVIGFVLNVIFANIFAPLSQESSWQRFRAFQISKLSLDNSLKKAVINSLILWLGLIIISFCLILLKPNSGMSSITAVLASIKATGSYWFPLVLFPLISCACLFAMYSTADTCVSALIYLIEYFYSCFLPRVQSNTNIKGFHKLGMLFVFIVAIGIYCFVHFYFNPSVLQLIFSVFSNLVVIAPTVLLTTRLSPINVSGNSKLRSGLILTSLILGTASYWATTIFAIIKGESFLWLSQLSILGGILMSFLPVAYLYIKNNEI